LVPLAEGLPFTEGDTEGGDFVAGALLSVSSSYLSAQGMVMGVLHTAVSVKISLGKKQEKRKWSWGL
jgi:hypothetical protein